MTKEISQTDRVLSLEMTIRSLEKANKQLKEEIKTQNEILNDPENHEKDQVEAQDELLKHKNSILEVRISSLEQAAMNFAQRELKMIDEVQLAVANESKLRMDIYEITMKTHNLDSEIE
jgi:hypothetical protein